MNWLKRFMKGRYGGDQLSMALIVLSVILTWIAGYTHFTILIFIGYIPLCVSIFRILSRDTRKRSMENYKFAIFMSPAYSWIRKVQYWAKDLKTHRRFNCPECKTKLRVPKGKGEIIVICPKCKMEFRKRT